MSKGPKCSHSRKQEISCVWVIQEDLGRSPRKTIKVQGGFQESSKSLALKPAQSSEALPGWMRVPPRQLAQAGLCFQARQRGPQRVRFMMAMAFMT